MRDQGLKQNIKDGHIHFQITTIKVIQTIKCNKTSFLSTEINRSFPTPVQCCESQVQVQMPYQAVATNQLPDHC